MSIFQFHFCRLSLNKHSLIHTFPFVNTQLHPSTTILLGVTKACFTTFRFVYFGGMQNVATKALIAIHETKILIILVLKAKFTAFLYCHW